MPVPDFLDSNVLVYAYDVSAPVKQRIAQDLVRKAIAGEMVVSAQVLAEFAATLLHKLAPPAAPDDVLAILDALAPVRVINPDGDLVRRAVEARAMYGLHFYDGMILAAAERVECKQIWRRQAIFWHHGGESLQVTGRGRNPKRCPPYLW